MSIRKTKLAPGEIYHVYNRGSFRHEIFHDKEDYDRFKVLLYLANNTKRFKIKDIKKYQNDFYKVEPEEKIVDIFSYALMPNHFHLMISDICKPPGKDGGVEITLEKNIDSNISLFLQKVTAGYSMYYNRKYKKTGALFEGKFKSEHIDNDRYLKYLFAYIHLNPIKLLQPDWREIGISDPKKARDFLEAYDHSSFIDYFINPNRKDGKLINKNGFIAKIENSDDLQKDMLEWLSYAPSASQYLDR